MPRFIPPLLSGAHRLACKSLRGNPLNCSLKGFFLGLSLYHALLSQCSKLQFISPRVAEIRKLIRVQFRQYKNLQSPTQIVNSLKAGYEVCQDEPFNDAWRMPD